ncbi:DUF937 domain-containing protein [Calothrix sp. UHCC 0171]|uniref:DUF937 domain-containing protein n=1 Tax=Calothrix sp. UHCC 0171 TaxID=3110245 RepID=UPI002B20DD65|nr:DUF937 domain-containing protein [Calothrix sp. UHCC 0171]MEA5572389.1 DUF937 domain-containing protein [Calothrix sp. UHCC 0171]
MSIFFDLLSAINNPNQQANVSQLQSIISSVQNLTANQGINNSQLQSIISIVGEQIRPALQQQQAIIGKGRLENLVSQVVTSGAGGSAFQSLFSPQLMQQIAETVTQKTGVNLSVVQSVIATITSTALSLLEMGAPQTGAWGTSNPLLNSFLDTDNDDDTDLGNVMKFANRFLNPASS